MTTGLRVLLGYEAALAGEGGIPRYVRRLAAELAGSTSVDSCRLIVGGRIESEPPAVAAGPAASPGFGRSMAGRVIGGLMRSPRLAEGYFAFRSQRSTQRLSAERFDILHEPNYVIRAAIGPTVVSIHDMSVFDMPAMHLDARVRALSLEIPRSLRVAHRVVTLSDFSKSAIAKRFPWASDKVDIVPIGIDEIFRTRPMSELAPLLAPLGLQAKGYLLFVGTFEPRKNLEGLLTAAKALREDGRPLPPIAIVGGGGWRNDALRSALAAAASEGAVRLLSQVSDETLAALYSGAIGVAFPSFYEGQGLPALEAAASGVPVLTSLGTPMAEYLAEHAVLVDPKDLRDLSGGLMRLAFDDSLQAEALAAAPRIAAAFGWKACLEATLESYRRAQKAAQQPMGEGER